MFDLLQQLFSEPEFKAKLKALRDLVDMTPDGFLAIIVCFLIFIGRKMVFASAEWRKNGLRAGIAVFLVVLGYEWWRAEVFGKEQLPLAALKAFNVGGLVLAGTWIVLPILSFVLSHFRLALAAFLGYAGYDLVTGGDFAVERFPDIALRGLVAVALVLLVAWIVHPIWDYIHALLPRPKRRTVEEEDRIAAPAVETTASHRELPPTPPPPVNVVNTPLEVVPQTEVPPTESQRRRDRIRLQVEMAYVMATPQLGSRLPREAFSELLQRYLGDHLPVEDIEENSRQLLQILQEQQKPGQTPQPTAPPSALLLEELLRRLVDEQKPHHAGNHHSAPSGQILHN
jgi:hypothetical protein